MANDSFSIYPKIKRLLLAYNKVHTVEPEALEALGDLELLDLTQNAVKEVPAGLPASLRWLYLGGNPVADLRHLARAVGLHTLVLRNCDLTAYPALGLLPNLVELDVSGNGGMDGPDPIRLAGTCRLARLNVTDGGDGGDGAARLFGPPGRPGAHCRCRRAVEWAKTYRIQMTGVPDPCPEPAAGDAGSGGEDDPDSPECARVPEAARTAFKACMAEWEHRNTPYWTIGSGLTVAVCVILALCVCLRRRRRRRNGRHGAADKEPPAGAGAGGGAAVSDKENGDAKEQLQHSDGGGGGSKTAEPAALLS